MAIFFTIEENQEKIRLRKKPGNKESVYATFMGKEYEFRVVANKVNPIEEASNLDEKVFAVVVNKIIQHFTNSSPE